MVLEETAAAPYPTPRVKGAELRHSLPEVLHQ